MTPARARARAATLQRQADALGNVAVNQNRTWQDRYAAAVGADEALDLAAEFEFLAKLRELAR